MDELIRELERKAYYNVLRTFRMQSNDLSWEKEEMLINLREELRISSDDHLELLRMVNTGDNDFTMMEFSGDIQGEESTSHGYINVREDAIRHREKSTSHGYLNLRENAIRQREESTSHGHLNLKENRIRPREESTSHDSHQYAIPNIPTRPMKTRRISESPGDDTRGQGAQSCGIDQNNDIPVRGRIRRHDNVGNTSILASHPRTEQEITLRDTNKLAEEVESVLAINPPNFLELQRAKNSLLEQEKDLLSAIAWLDCDSDKDSDSDT